MNTRETDRLKMLLQTALPPTRDADPERDPVPERDLWPEIRQRIAGDAPSPSHAIPWFDWVLAGGVAVVAVAFPAAVPLFLYYL
jgi:hypothetical protein